MVKVKLLALLSLKTKFNSDTWIYALLLLLSFCIYFFYYQHLILNLNAVLFKAEGDSLKNYYTYAYHVKNDVSILDFRGLNYPFGEHVVYTDCQPLLSFILQAFPATHFYLIGIMHGLILLSFIITPLILFRIFILLDNDRFPAFFSALAIAILSPQIHRLGGHFALAYGCIIPFGILFVINYFGKPAVKNLTVLFIYNTLLFFIHPYFGLGLSAFCFISIFSGSLIGKKTAFTKNIIAMFVSGVLPVLVFKLFMSVTDTHTNRPDEPFGVDIMGAAANAESVFTPSFGPFIHVLKKFIRAEHVEWEALCYIGVFSLFMMVMAIVLLPFYFRKIQLRKDVAAMFITALLFLFFSFGVHIRVLNFLNIEIVTLNQFRAFGRFAWYFYFLLPIFLITALSSLLRTKNSPVIVATVSLVFFAFNMLEGHFLLRSMTTDTFLARNIFNGNLLTDAEKEVVKQYKNKKVAAILPLPVFHIGSEVYQRNGDESIAPAMMYSYHLGLPVLSVMLSRTSLNETETALEILNQYKEKRKIDSLTNNATLLVVKTGSNLKEDEKRLVKKLKLNFKTDQQEFFTAESSDFKAGALDTSTFLLLKKENFLNAKNMLFLHFEDRMPFLATNINSYETITEIDSNFVDPGDYTISFHYHLKEKKFRYIHTNLIVIKKTGASENWEYFTSVRSTSGFYKDFIVFEQSIRIDAHSRYQFILNGPMKETYFVSDFLLKPETVDVKILQDKTVLYNNYPR